MESRAKLFGHAAHAMLVVFPLGLLVSSLLFDITYLFTRNEAFTRVAYWNIVGGVIGGLVAAIPGVVDWMAIPRGTRARAIGTRHAIGNVILLILFGASGWLRRETSGHVPDTLALTLAVAAVGLGTVTAWLGGELVERLGIGVTPGAHPDAPSSLATSGEEVAARATERRRGGTHA